MFTWRPAGWRWLTLKKENFPIVVTGVAGTIILSTLLAY
jgi:hypothetical protein